MNRILNSLMLALALTHPEAIAAAHPALASASLPAHEEPRAPRSHPRGCARAQASEGMVKRHLVDVFAYVIAGVAVIALVLGLV